jgi:hypothetical protein
MVGATAPPSSLPSSGTGPSWSQPKWGVALAFIGGLGYFFSGLIGGSVDGLFGIVILVFTYVGYSGKGASLLPISYVEGRMRKAGQSVQSPAQIARALGSGIVCLVSFFALVLSPYIMIGGIIWGFLGLIGGCVMIGLPLRRKAKEFTTTPTVQKATYCGNCGSELDPKQISFCPNCGQKIQ